MADREPIAIVRMASLLPGALSAEAFWDNVQRGHSAIRDVPDGRWHVRPDDILDVTPQADRTYARKGGFVEGFRFDPADLKLSRDFVAELDPLFHWVLHVGREVTRGARMNR